MMRRFSSERSRRRLGLFAFVGALGLVVLAPGPARGATLQVCPTGPPTCPYGTIAGALDAAANGDTIKIAAGTYLGGFTIDKDVSLVGAGADQTAISGGGTVVRVSPGVTATIEKVAITGGTASGIVNSGTLTVERSTVTRNTAVQGGGGGIANFATATLRHSDVSDNTASDCCGGGIRSGDPNHLSAMLTLIETTVRHNRAATSGGGIQIFGGAVALEKSTVSGNVAVADSGGGIQAGGGGTVTLETSTVRDNTAGRQGGGISSYGGAVTVVKSAISGNTSASFGGGIASDGPVMISESTIGDNRSTGHPVEGGGGGGICGRLELVYRSTISGNRSARSFGGMCGAKTIIESTVRDNTAALDGGGFGCCAGGVTTVKKTAVTGNSAGGSGGGIFTRFPGPGNPLIIEDTTISKNRADADGGGMVVDTPTTLERTTVKDNSAGARGGGIFRKAFRALTLDESTVTKNAAVNGGGIFLEVGPPVTLTSSTVSKNTPNDCAPTAC
jgi:hypothetical protein